MADGSSGGGSNGFLFFIVGALIVVVAVIGYFVFAGGHGLGGGHKSLDVTVSSPNLPKPGS